MLLEAHWVAGLAVQPLIETAVWVDSVLVGLGQQIEQPLSLDVTPGNDGDYSILESLEDPSSPRPDEYMADAELLDSLREGVDRMVMVCEVTLGPGGNVLSSRLFEGVMRSLAKDPADRFQTAMDLRAALTGAFGPS